jgi:hypothetical protein
MTVTGYPAEELEVGDQFTSATRSSYEVAAINPSHRAEYGAVLDVTNLDTGRTSTVAFRPGTTVTLNRSHR